MREYNSVVNKSCTNFERGLYAILESTISVNSPVLRSMPCGSVYNVVYAQVGIYSQRYRVYVACANKRNMCIKHIGASRAFRHMAFRHLTFAKVGTREKHLL